MSKNSPRWVGLDVHRETIAACWLTGDGQREEAVEIPNEPRRLKRLIEKLSTGVKEVRVCYEAGPCGYEVRRQLDKMGIQCAVIAPSLIPRRASDRIKTDHRDARKLARLYRAGELTEIRVPTEQEEAARDLVRAREDLVEDTTRARHRLGRLLLRYGRVYREGKHWTAGHWRWVKEQQLAQPAAQRALDECILQLEFRLQRLASLDEEMVALAQQEPFRPMVERILCLRGFDTLTALTLVVELGDLRRFDSPRSLMAYVGMVPSLYASGNTERRGAITKNGNAHARRVLVESAHHYRHRPGLYPRLRRALDKQPPPIVATAMKTQTRLNQRYRALVGRSKRVPIAVVAVARELCGFLWALEQMA